MEKDITLKISNLYKSYGEKEVLKGIDLEVYSGEVFGFIGKNGAGKSTTIDAIVGLKNFDCGSISVNGISVKDDPIACKKMIGYVPSEPASFEVMTGYEYLRFIASCFQISQPEFEENLKNLQDQFMLSDEDLSHLIKGYSHGMKQKLCLIASLIHNLSLWILDEPTVGLDLMVYQTLIEMLPKFAKQNKTVFVTSHNIDLVTRVCDRVAIINNGVVSQLIDFNVEPEKRETLSKIFFDTYSRE